MAAPKPDQTDLTTLIADIESGVVKIPAFQRDLVWGMDKTLSLLDSLAKEYPIGSFLFWESDEYINSLRNIGNIELATVPEGRLVNYILDGQQRISSLYAAANAATVKLADERERSYKVWVDLDADGDAEPIFREEADGRPCVPFDALVGRSPHLVTKELDDRRAERFDSLRRIFLNYSFSIIRVRQQPLDIVCDIFERINNLGTPLTVFDLVAAKTWSPKFDLRDEVESCLEHFRPSKYDSLSSTVFVQTASALARGSVRRVDVLKLDRRRMPRIWKDVREYLSLAVDFARTGIGIPVGQMLPYPSVLVAFARFFAKNKGKQPTAKQAKLLKSYFWRAGVSRRYTGAAETALNQDLRLMNDIAAGKTNEIPFGADVTRELVVETPLSGSNALSKTFLCLLAVRGPRRFQTNDKVIIDGAHLSRANSRHYHHFFPKAHLRGHPLEAYANSIANVTLISADDNLGWSSKAPWDYLKSIQHSANPDVLRSLDSHHIGDVQTFGITKDNFRTFLDKRSRRLATALRRKL